LVGFVPHGRWKTITLVAGLCHDAVVAPLVIDGPLHGKIFHTHVERSLAPTLDRGDIVFMDNLATHKVAGVTERDGNLSACVISGSQPIEQVFSKLKAQGRRADRSPGCGEESGRSCATITKTECRNFFRNAGYV
jgi:hypothetical protein